MRSNTAPNKTGISDPRPRNRIGAGKRGWTDVADMTALFTAGTEEEYQAALNRGDERAERRNPRMNDSGNYEAHAWPGGYPIYYITANGGVLCPICANDNAMRTCDQDDKQWYIVAFEINWEDTDLWCAHDGRRIESAYEEE